ncbi:MAG: hypothetical protein A3F91_09820 [Flavobacteria bacterium RIFCSPLOWO2_12_FULL_35_11]|nr:MAG: hypothetical protein A3F91_09820 [Flavobacteria bacterium RIFCSPLOWO2_12_FULL_35_11]
MIINVRASSSVDFGKYLTDREQSAFTIIEGNAQRIDSIAEAMLLANPKKKISHYSYVLSFKEKNLTKDEIMDYYFQFREMMFKNYNSNELEMLSVIHWDDNKPHIHCTVINGSQLDSERDLRLYRGYADFPRIEAVQEKINYENNLSSPFDNYNLLSLTKEQKRRDWLVKKGNSYFPVYDDTVFREVEKSIKEAKSFSGFLESLEKKLGKVSVFNANKFNNGGFGKNTLLKECTLVLDDKIMESGGKFIFTSKLFDKTWFTKNLAKIQSALERTTLENIKFATSKKSLAQYNKMYDETTKKHAEHLFERNVGDKFVSKNLNSILNDNLQAIINIDIKRTTRDVVEASVERYLDNCNGTFLKKFVEEIPFEYEVKKDSVRYFKENNFFEIYNEKLVQYYKEVLPLRQEEKISSGNLSGSEPFSKDYEINDFDEKEFLALLLQIKSNKNKAKIRLLLEKLLYETKVLNKKELEAILAKYGLSILRAGVDEKKGGYLTIGNKSGKVSLYNDFFYSLSAKEKFPEEIIYKSERDLEIAKSLLKNTLSSYVKSVYLDVVDKESKKFVNCVNDYRLLNVPELGDGFIQSNGFIYSRELLEYKQHAVNNYEIVNDYKNGSLEVKKSLNKFQTGKNLADMYHLRGEIDIYVDGEKFDGDLLKGFIARTKEMDYNLTLWDSNNNYLYGTSMIFDNSSPEKSAKAQRAAAVETVRSVETEFKDALNEVGGAGGVLAIIRSLDALDMNSKAGVAEFRRIISDMNKNDAHLFNAVCTNMGVEILKSGSDKEKGDYTTFLYREKKVAVYDGKLAENAIVSGIVSREVLV